MIFVKWHLIQSNFMGQICFQLSLLVNTLYKKRRYWMTEYNQSSFENILIKCNEILFNEICQKEFSMRPETFEYLLDMIRLGIEKLDTNFRKATTAEKWLAMALWHFLTWNAYRTISKVFGIAKSLVIKIVQQVTYDHIWVTYYLNLSNFLWQH